MRPTKKVVLATTNHGKFDEFKHLFAKYPNVDPVLASEILVNADKIGNVEIHDSYLENAMAKARIVGAACHYPSLADDSGLEVDALGGKPGIMSARYAPKTPGKTQDQANTDFLLSQLKAESPTSARFVCHLALVIEGVLIHATGYLEGDIIRTPRGTQGFGYDPIFIPKGFTKTLAELTHDEKNNISHRARALHELMEKVRSLNIVFAMP